MATQYWMPVSSPENFEVSRELGFYQAGHQEPPPEEAERMQAGDRGALLPHRAEGLGGTATIASPYWEEHEPLWKSNEEGRGLSLPLQITPDVILDPDQFLPAEPLAAP